MNSLIILVGGSHWWEGAGSCLDLFLCSEFSLFQEYSLLTRRMEHRGSSRGTDFSLSFPELSHEVDPCALLVLVNRLQAKHTASTEPIAYLKMSFFLSLISMRQSISKQSSGDLLRVSCLYKTL